MMLNNVIRVYFWLSIESVVIDIEIDKLINRLMKKVMNMKLNECFVDGFGSFFWMLMLVMFGYNYEVFCVFVEVDIEFCVIVVEECLLYEKKGFEKWFVDFWIWFVFLWWEWCEY